MKPGEDALPEKDPMIELSDGDLLLLSALCHIRRGDPLVLVTALLRGAALAYYVADFAPAS